LTDEWRIILYYPLGILASMFFSLRLLIQWFKSEKLGFSYVDETFWKLSLIGNLFLLVHYTIQGQYPFSLVQVANGLISWRNLDLMTKKPPYSLLKTVLIFISVLLLSCLFFAVIGALTNTAWMNIPRTSSSSTVKDPGLLWHAMGFLGQGLFSSRFWLQWWASERNQKSELGLLFWWTSLVGSILSGVYFLKIHDVISFLGQFFGVIPYFRNLMLMRNQKLQARKLS
jgi:lipid-A-disaccharide synthase